MLNIHQNIKNSNQHHVIKEHNIKLKTLKSTLSYYIKGTKFKAFGTIHLSQNILIQKKLEINVI